MRLHCLSVWMGDCPCKALSRIEQKHDVAGLPDSGLLVAAHEQPQQDAHCVSVHASVQDDPNILQEGALMLGVPVQRLRHQQRGCVLVGLPAQVQRLRLAYLRERSAIVTSP